MAVARRPDQLQAAADERVRAGTRAPCDILINRYVNRPTSLTRSRTRRTYVIRALRDFSLASNSSSSSAKRNLVRFWTARERAISYVRLRRDCEMSTCEKRLDCGNERALAHRPEGGSVICRRRRLAAYTVLLLGDTRAHDDTVTPFAQSWLSPRQPGRSCDVRGEPSRNRIAGDRRPEIAPTTHHVCFAPASSDSISHRVCDLRPCSRCTRMFFRVHSVAYMPSRIEND